MAKYKGLSLGGLDRHQKCIEALFAEVREQKRAGLLASVDEVKTEIVQLKADFPDNPNVRLGIVGKMLDTIEKEAKLTGAYIKDAANPADRDRTAFLNTFSTLKKDGYTDADAVAAILRMEPGYAPYAEAVEMGTVG